MVETLQKKKQLKQLLFMVQVVTLVLYVLSCYTLLARRKLYQQSQQQNAQLLFYCSGVFFLFLFFKSTHNFKSFFIISS